MGQNSDTTSTGGEDKEQQELSFMAGGSANWCSHFGRWGGGVSQKHPLIMQSATVSLDVDSNVMKSPDHTKICLKLFIAASIRIKSKVPSR